MGMTRHILVPAGGIGEARARQEGGQPGKGGSAGGGQGQRQGGLGHAAAGSRGGGAGKGGAVGRALWESERDG